MVVKHNFQAGILIAILSISLVSGLSFVSSTPTILHAELKSVKAQAPTGPKDQKILYSLPIHEAYFSGHASITSLPANRASALEISDRDGNVCDRIMFSNQLFRLRKGDLNRDGNDEILVGIIKKNKFDPTNQKRMLIFYVDSLHLRPLFLSTNLYNEIIDFGVSRFNKKQITTIEKTNSDEYKIGIYAWLDFGFVFKGYKRTYSFLTDCQEEFNHEIYQ